MSLLLGLFGQNSSDKTLVPFKNLAEALGKIPVSKSLDELLPGLMLHKRIQGLNQLSGRELQSSQCGLSGIQCQSSCLRSSTQTMVSKPT